ncbi:hypothetical protein [Embleya sp. NPDC059237]|uniref:hypothetical protein n=1 Tax=Embleya sp. NPDC059237 TaxID=3346784 RepID=UPI0036ACE7C9
MTDKPGEGADECRHWAPLSWQSWQRREAGVSRAARYEYPLYTDAYVTEYSVSIGPFEFINTLAHDVRDPRMAPGIVLRLDVHPDSDTAPYSVGTDLGQLETQAEEWLGLAEHDEVAVLASLALGIRLRSTGATRQFLPDGDPLGQPIEYDHRPPPWTITSNSTSLVLPGYAEREVCLTELKDWFDRYRRLPAGDALTLVRAARNYRDALWIADDDPETAWLWLVSALEAAAVREQITGIDKIELLGMWKRKVKRLIEETGDEVLLRRVAKELASLGNTTARYLKLVEVYAPGPPLKRPSEHLRVDWSPEGLAQAAELIYNYRSRRLHEGTPFPWPMYGAPFHSMAINESVAPERPGGIASHSGRNRWTAEDLPMHLHIYTYLTRGTLLNWWKVRAERAEDQPA